MFLLVLIHTQSVTQKHKKVPPKTRQTGSNWFVRGDNPEKVYQYGETTLGVAHVTFTSLNHESCPLSSLCWGQQFHTHFISCVGEPLYQSGLCKACLATLNIRSIPCECQCYQCSFDQWNMWVILMFWACCISTDTSKIFGPPPIHT